MTAYNFYRIKQNKASKCIFCWKQCCSNSWKTLSNHESTHFDTEQDEIVNLLSEEYLKRFYKIRKKIHPQLINIGKEINAYYNQNINQPELNESHCKLEIRVSAQGTRLIKNNNI